MNKLLMISGLICISLLLVGSVSAYYCIQEEDHEEVKEFKSKINILSIKEDLRKGVTPEAIKLKIKYFGGCN